MTGFDWPGVCAQRILAIDWSDSPLGPIDRWPAALVQTLTMMLRSASPKVLIWGDSLTTFFNDSILATMHEGSIDGIGTPYPQFRPELWEQMKSDVARVAGGEYQLTAEVVRDARFGRGDTEFYRVCFSRTPLARDNQFGILLDLHDETPARRTEARLREENLLIQGLFAEAPVFIAYFAADKLTIELCNRAFEKAFGKHDVMTRPLLEAIPELAEQGFREVLDHALATGELWSSENTLVRVVDSRTGLSEDRFFDMMLQPVAQADGPGKGLLCAGYDVTTRSIAQAKADSLRDNLLHLSRINAMGTMAMTLAHELNQPLAAAENYLNAGLRIDAQDPLAYRNVLSRAKEQVERAATVIRTMRTALAKGEVEREPVAIRAAFARSRQLLDPDLCQGFVFETEIAPGSEAVLFEKVQFEQVLYNLLNNSLNASADSPVRKVILSAALSGRARIRITLRDFGSGFASHQLDALFDRVGSSSGKGLGMGLALTRTIVEANGGSIHGANLPDGGAMITLEVDRAG